MSRESEDGLGLCAKCHEEIMLPDLHWSGAWTYEGEKLFGDPCLYEEES